LKLEFRPIGGSYFNGPYGISRSRAYLKTDQRSFPADWEQFLINGNDPVTLPLIDPLRFDSIPMFRPIFTQMLKAG
jgi:hypothetical protein